MTFFHRLNRYMRYSVYFLTHFSCQGSHPEGDCMDGVCSHCRYVPPLPVCGLFCHMGVLGSLLVCLPESSAGEQGLEGFYCAYKAWATFPK